MPHFCIRMMGHFHFYRKSNFKHGLRIVPYADKMYKTISRFLLRSHGRELVGSANFNNILNLAFRARLAYGSEKDINGLLNGYGKEVYTTLLYDSSIRVILEVDHDSMSQCLIIRGTCNDTNVMLNMGYIKKECPHLNAHVHKGFLQAAYEVMDWLNGRLVEGYKFSFTGHSLGGAVATVTAMLLSVQTALTFDVSYTFGQPKVTDSGGVVRFRHIPLIRINNEDDVVARLPPLTFVSAIHGPYRHFGSELVLLDEVDYIWFPGKYAERFRLSSLFLNPSKINKEQHSMLTYLNNLQNRVSYDDQ